VSKQSRSIKICDVCGIASLVHEASKVCTSFSHGKSSGGILSPVKSFLQQDFYYISSTVLLEISRALIWYLLLQTIIRIHENRQVESDDVVIPGYGAV
jgi:hypothetical protein